MVIELGRAAGAAAVIGIISMPGRRSRHNIDDMLDPDSDLGVVEVLDPIGVILTEDGIKDLPSVKSKRREEALLPLRVSESLLFSFCLL
jgi:hypothetical protein